MYVRGLAGPDKKQTITVYPQMWVNKTEMLSYKIPYSAFGQLDKIFAWKVLDLSDSSCKQLFESSRGPIWALESHHLEELCWERCLLLICLGVSEKK